eukprot:scaffold5569_cov116-Isochrysis_galbana.AAC.6
MAAGCREHAPLGTWLAPHGCLIIATPVLLSPSFGDRGQTSESLLGGPGLGLPQAHPMPSASATPPRSRQPTVYRQTDGHTNPTPAPHALMPDRVTRCGSAHPRYSHSPPQTLRLQTGFRL